MSVARAISNIQQGIGHLMPTVQITIRSVCWVVVWENQSK